MVRAGGQAGQLGAAADAPMGVALWVWGGPAVVQLLRRGSC